MSDLIRKDQLEIVASLIPRLWHGRHEVRQECRCRFAAFTAFLCNDLVVDLQHEATGIIRFSHLVNHPAKGNAAGLRMKLWATISMIESGVRNWCETVVMKLR